MAIEGFGLILNIYPHSDNCFRSTTYLGMIVFGIAAFLLDMNEQMTL